MSAHIIAVDTYGAQRVTDPRTGKTVSAYKLGYSSAVTAVLLALYGGKARDVSPKRASYCYAQIDGDVIVRHGHILLTLTPDELAKADRITRQHQLAGVYLWRDRKWWALPDSTHTDYSEPGYRVGPTFDPTGFRPPAPSTGERESAINGIIVERSQREDGGSVWWWLLGDTYPHRELLKRWGARFSGKRKAWYYVGSELPRAIDQLIRDVNAEKPSDAHSSITSDDAPCSLEEPEAILGVHLRRDEQPTRHDSGQVTSHQQRLSPNGAWGNQDDAERIDPPSGIRILPPQPAEGAIATAIERYQPDLSPTLRPPGAISGKARSTLIRIPHEPVGELTGSITGSVWCYGYATHDGICIYVSMGGPRMAVEAIRAKLTKGDIVNCVPWDAPSVELTAGEGNSGMYHAYMTNIPEAKFTSLILVHEWAVAPNYNGAATTFVFRTDDSQATAKLKHHVTELVKVPVFDTWAGYLYDAGQIAGLVRKTRSAGGIDVLTVDLDATAWTRLITGGLARELVQLPLSV